MTVAALATETVSQFVYPYLLTTDDPRGVDYQQSILVVESDVERIGDHLRVVIVADQIFPRCRTWLVDELVKTHGLRRLDAEKEVQEAWAESDHLYARRKYIGMLPVHLHYRRRTVKQTLYFYESGFTGTVNPMILKAAPTLKELVGLHLASDADAIDRAIELNIEFRSSVKRPYAEQMIYLTKKIRGLK